jgi:hypothetical protein
VAPGVPTMLRGKSGTFSIVLCISCVGDAIDRCSWIQTPSAKASHAPSGPWPTCGARREPPSWDTHVNGEGENVATHPRRMYTPSEHPRALARVEELNRLMLQDADV